eukprot:4012173-Pyramimonas_sp.AAC.1
MQTVPQASPPMRAPPRRQTSCSAGLGARSRPRLTRHLTSPMSPSGAAAPALLTCFRSMAAATPPVPSQQNR